MFRSIVKERVLAALAGVDIIGNIVIIINIDKHIATTLLGKMRNFAFLNEFQICAKGNKKRADKYSFFSCFVSLLKLFISTLLSCLFIWVSANSAVGELVIF